MTLAKDIMTTKIISIKPETSVIAAIDLLLEHRISGLPVVDDQMHLSGILSEKDLLNILFQKDVNVNTPVERFMSKKVLKFDVNASAIDICDFFLNHAVRRVPIVQDDKLVGIVSRRDALKLVLSTVLSLGNKNAD